MNDTELERYSRHILMPQIDAEGQMAIRSAHVAVIGLGGLGSPVALYLAAAGVGKLTLMDHDVVDLSNLQRQIVHADHRIGMDKVRSAGEALQQLNPGTEVVEIARKANTESLDEHLQDVSVLVDCTDNSVVRYELNRWCLKNGVPWVSGAAVGLSGHLMIFDPRSTDSPCYACLFPSAPEVDQSCADTGVLAPVVGVIGSLQATEALRLIVDFGPAQAGRMLIWDVSDGKMQHVTLPRLNDCPECNGLERTDR